MINGLLFTFGLVALFATVNALRRPSQPPSRFPPLWLPAMITGELATLWLLTRIVVLLIGFATGAWSNSVGRIGLLSTAASLLALVPILVERARYSRRLPAARGKRGSISSALLGRHVVPDAVELILDIPYSPENSLDLYAPLGASAPTPLLIYVHGGGWTGGSPHKQARSLFHRLAQGGWHVATIRYPLSPEATFPDHLVSVKRAIAWAKHDARFDPAKVVIAGGSAGGHLAALAALTAREARFQPGFENADTSVAGCIPMYGIYDFLNRNQTRWDWPVIPRHVMKATAQAAPEAYRDASPLDNVHPGAPPFFVVHGAKDSLVPPAEAHQFIEALQAVGVTVEYYEVPGAQHAFDALDTPRSRYVAHRIFGFLDRLVESVG